jgi:hypothetical protein
MKRFLTLFPGQYIRMSVSFAMTACCISFVIAPRRIVRLIHGMRAIPAGVRRSKGGSTGTVPSCLQGGKSTPQQ